MKYKILVLDIDGTLVNSDKIITEKTKMSIMKAQELGVKVVIATGRPYAGMKKYSEELMLDKFGGYIIAYNGCEIMQAYDEQVIFKENFDMKYAHQLYDMSRKYNTGIMTYDGETVITEDKEDKYIALEARINGMPVEYVESFKEYVNYPVIKCIMTADSEYLANVEKYIADEMQDVLNVFRSEPFFLEILPKKIDKAYALKILCESLNINMSDTVACGDGYNDITMIQAAGFGIAMENAHTPVKEAADYVTLSNEEDGIAKVIQHFIVC